MSDKLDQIREDIQELRIELKEFAKLSLENKQDLIWVKGSFKVVATIFATVISSILVFFLPKA